MNYKYAQIDENGICIGISDLSGEVIASDMIPRQSGDGGELLGKKWNGETWEDVPQPEPHPIAGWPTISKYDFRQLLTDTQKRVFDNYDLLKTQLNMSDDQYMTFRSFRNDFDSAQVIDMEGALMTTGLNTVASWNLILDTVAIFTQTDVDRILAGQPHTIGE